MRNLKALERKVVFIISYDICSEWILDAHFLRVIIFIALILILISFSVRNFNFIYSLVVQHTSGFCLAEKAKNASRPAFRIEIPNEFVY